ncbi:MAG TPA: ABC transporter permease [Vicinamibacterales bacterium]|nr:ABC transporter permease [Vicinamibacterales bacterium]
MRHALRLLGRSPVFTITAVLSLAAGIGTNSAIFSMADALILRPPAIRDPATVVSVDVETPGQLSKRISYPNYLDLARSSQSFEGLVANEYSSASFARSRGDVREMRRGMLVSGNFFDVLGVSPALGRVFTQQEGQVSGRDAVVVLNYDFWANSLGRDPSIVDSVVWMNGIDFHVIGVARAGFTDFDPVFRPAFYVPIAMAQRLGGESKDPLADRASRLVWVDGRLKSGISKERARAELRTIWGGLQQQYPEATMNGTIAVRSELEERIDQDPWDSVLLAILAALAALVLAIACANVANLMLGRGRSRTREMAIRLALGVGRQRLLRQLFTESLVLAAIGFVFGLVVAYGGIRLLHAIPPAEQIVIAPQLDRRVVIFGLVVAAVSAIVFGLAPARQSLRTDLAPALKVSEPQKATRQKTLGRHVLVVGQVAMSMVALVAAGLFLDGLRKAIALDPGFRTDHLMMMTTDTSLVRYTPEQTRAFYQNLRDQARGLPGVQSVTVTSDVPLTPNNLTALAVLPEGYQFPRGQEAASILAAVTDERYFETMRIPVIRGRHFSAEDKLDSPRVAIVNEEFGKTYWPGQDPIGKRVRISELISSGNPGRPLTGTPWVQVVGLTSTGKYSWIGEVPTPFLYIPFAQHDTMRMSLLMESRNDPAQLADLLRAVVRSLDINQPVFNLQTYSSFYHQRAIAGPVIIMQLVGALGLLALTLALVGLYALVQYSVARRTREIGIRMAIGAARTDVLTMVLRQGFLISLAGIAVGAAASLAVARLLAAVLVGLGAPSRAIFGIVPVMLLMMTMAATYFPARRASRVDPVIAIRDE